MDTLGFFAELLLWYRGWCLRKAHPCPCCGGKRKLGLYIRDIPHTGFVTVVCNDWHCLYPYTRVGVEHSDRAEEHCIEARSTRAAVQRYNARAEWIHGLRKWP